MDSNASKSWNKRQVLLWFEYVSWSKNYNAMLNDIAHQIFPKYPPWFSIIWFKYQFYCCNDISEFRICLAEAENSSCKSIPLVLFSPIIIRAVQILELIVVFLKFIRECALESILEWFDKKEEVVDLFLRIAPGWLICKYTQFCHKGRLYW